MKKQLYKILLFMPLILLLPAILLAVIVFMNGHRITIFNDIQLFGYQMSSFTLFLIMLFWIYIVSPIIALMAAVTLLTLYRDKRERRRLVVVLFLALLIFPGLTVLFDFISLLSRNIFWLFIIKVFYTY